MSRILITIALAFYNNVANLWPPFNRWAYVPANVTTTVALAVIATNALDLSASELGLRELSLADAGVGLSIGAVIGAGLLMVATTRRGARVIADRRVAGLRGGMLVYQTLVRVPFGTALLEEFAFRGVLFAAWRDEGTATAAVISSIVFGLWHITPATIMVRANDPDAPRRSMARTVVGTLVLTTLVGLALVWLRLETGSLLAPFVAHAGVNSIATWLGARSARRTGLRRWEIDRDLDHM